MPSKLPSIPLVSTTVALLLGACASPEPPATQQQDATASAPIGDDPVGAPTQHAIILHHGFAASSSFNGFHGVAEALEADGHFVVVSDAPPFQPTDVRAFHLADAVEQALHLGFARVNIIAHSMGGLDARVLVSHFGYGDYVASITTISSPHRGTAIADLVLDKFDSAAGQQALEHLAGAFGAKISDVGDDAAVIAALADMTEAGQASFNAATPDDPFVHYMSVGGVSNVAGIPNPKDDDACLHTAFAKADGTLAYPLGGKADIMDPILKPIAAVVAHGWSLTPNDGVVSVASAQWGQFLGCVPADHADEIGQFGDDGLNTRTGWDHVRFYRNHAFYLAALGY